ncbi:hypothetical protein [Treponema sp.]|uniref:hypothetical protein n=1 Tax=Treponema sp. TaxID=166 RepID=UPI00298EB06D|nr:hypothetical protein [Treponema sp.]MCR5614525.1 hypothetical protein [Treponema sp.]
MSGITEILISVGSKDFTSAGKPDVTVNPSAIVQDSEDSTKFNWSATIPAAKITRSGTVWARVKDGAGNTAELNLFSLQVDDEDPEIDFADSIKNSTVNKKITISGTANDNQKLELITLEYQSGVSGTGASAVPVWTELTTDGTPAASAPASKKVSGTYNWKLVDVDTEIAFGSTIYDCNSTKAGTQVKLRVTATDAAGNTKTAETEITVDQNTDRPVISFTNLSSLSKTEDGVTTYMSEDYYPFFENLILKGNVSDDDGIDSSVVVKVISKLWDITAATPVAPAAPTDAEWEAASPLIITAGGWTARLAGQGKQDIYFYVKDAKGAVFVSKAENAYDAVYIKDDTTTYGDAEHSSSILRLRVDTVNPEGKNLKYRLFSKQNNAYATTDSGAEKWDESVSGKVFGGDTSKFAVKIEASDANGIKEVVGIMGESEDDQGYHRYSFTYTGTDTTNKNGVWICNDILTGNTSTTGNLADGINYFTVEVIDNANRTHSSSAQLTVDNTKPEITIKIPVENSQATMSGEINVYGSLSEVCKVYYAVSTVGNVSPDDTTTPVKTWIKHENGTNPKQTVTLKDSSNNDLDIKDRISYSSQIRGTTTEWYVYFDGDVDSSQALTHTQLFNDYLVDYGITTRAALDSTEDDKFEDIVDLYLWIKAVDTAGNVTEKAQVIYLDPQGDKPTVSISYPEKDGEVLGGTIKLYGEASDNKFVDTVWVQIISKKEHASDWSSNVKYTENSSVDVQGKTVYTYSNVFTKFEPTKADLDFLADEGYSIYKIDTYTDTSTPWEKGTSNLAAGEKASDYGILANFSGSTWNLKINEEGEFNPDTSNGSASENLVAVRLISKDGDGKKSVYANRLFKIDNDKPVFGSTEPFAFVKSTDVSLTTAETAKRMCKETEDMFIKGSWYLIGSVEDDVGIKNLKLIDNKKAAGAAGRITKLIENQEVQSGGNDFDVAVNGRIVNFKIKLETAVGVGSLDYTLEAEDIADGQSHTATKDIKIYYDNVDPVLAGSTENGYNISSSVKQKNNFYVFGSSVKEQAVGSANQSGFDYVAFYFMRRSDRTTDSKNYIYDVMLKRSNTTGEGAGAVTDFNYNKIDLNGSGITYEDGLYWNSKTVTRDPDNLRLLTMPAADKNVHAGGLVKIGGSIYMIKSVEGADVTLAEDVDVNYTDALFAYAMVVNNTVTEGESGTLQDDGYYIKPSNDDGDRMMESVSKAGTTWAWEADICSKNIPDGPIELHYVAFDKAGNYSIGIMGYVPQTAATASGEGYSKYTTPDATAAKGPSVYAYNSESPAFVCNNQPRIAGVIFGTDDNGDGNVTDGSVVNGKATAEEFITSYSGWYNASSANKVTGVTVNGKDERGNAVTEFKIPNDLSDSAITIKGRTVIKPEIVGGNNGLSYTYSVTKNGETAPYYNSGATVLSEEDSITDDIRSDITIDLTTQKLLTKDSANKTIADGTKQTFAFKIWDETEGTNAGTTSQFATIKLVANVVLADSEKATVKIKPFWWRWNSTANTTETSIYYKTVNNKKVAAGHIELEDDWKATAGTDGAYLANATTGVRDADPKVSGTIALRGVAEDNVRVNEIYLKIPGFTTNDGFIKVADRTLSGEWQSLGTLDVNGWAFELDGEEQFSQSGNVVNFIIWWNTEGLSTVAKTDVKVELMAKDKGKVTLDANGTDLVYTTTGESAASTTQTTNAAMTPFYKMDVVPYITGIKNRVGNAYTKDLSVFGRSATGLYPVYYNSTAASNKGESFTVEGFNLGNSPKISVNGGTATTGATVTVTDTMTSGGVVVTVGTGTNAVSSLNNINYNDACGSFEAGELSGYGKYKNYYNRQPNNINNSTLTDDCKVAVWDINLVVEDLGVRYPSMRVGSNGTVGWVYGSGSAQVKMKKGDNNAFRLDTSYTQWYATAVAVDNLGQLYGAAQNGDTGGTGSYEDNNGYNQYSRRTNYKMYAFNSTQRTATNYDDTSGAYSTGGYSSALENIQYNGTVYSERVKSPKIVAVGSGTRNGNAYMAYYDSAENIVKFRSGTINGTTYSGGLAARAHGSSSASGAITIADSTMAGEYVGLGVTTDNKAVVAWYASDAQALYYKYQTATGWSNAVLIDDGFVGWYVDLIVDGLNGVHIAYYDAGNGDLKYAYIENYTQPVNAKVMTVDSYLSSGTNISISVKNTGTAEAPVYVPYISSFMSSFNKTSFTVRTAWITNGAWLKSKIADELQGVVEDDFTGVWEVMTVPLAKTSIPLDYSVSIGIKDGTPILGYGTKSGLETAQMR